MRSDPVFRGMVSRTMANDRSFMRATGANRLLPRSAGFGDDLWSARTIGRRSPERQRFFQALSAALGRRKDAMGQPVRRQVASPARNELGQGRNESSPTGSEFGRYGDLIQSAAARHGLSPELVAAVIGVESNFNAEAVSQAGAKGLMQLMDGTARSLGVSDSFNPAQNIDGGTRFLKGLLSRFHGDLSLALAGYNAGAGAVDRYGGIPPYQETRAYVSRVLARLKEYGGA